MRRCCVQFVLSVEAVRVGAFALVGQGTITPRSLAVATHDGDVVEAQELKKMSNVLLHVSTLAAHAGGPLWQHACLDACHAVLGRGRYWFDVLLN